MKKFGSVLNLSKNELVNYSIIYNLIDGVKNDIKRLKKTKKDIFFITRFICNGEKMSKITDLVIGEQKTIIRNLDILNYNFFFSKKKFISFRGFKINENYIFNIILLSKLVFYIQTVYFNILTYGDTVFNTIFNENIFTKSAKKGPEIKVVPGGKKTLKKYLKKKRKKSIKKGGSKAPENTILKFKMILAHLLKNENHEKNIKTQHNGGSRKNQKGGFLWMLFGAMTAAGVGIWNKDEIMSSLGYSPSQDIENMTWDQHIDAMCEMPGYEDKQWVSVGNDTPELNTLNVNFGDYQNTPIKGIFKRFENKQEALDWAKKGEGRKVLDIPRLAVLRTLQNVHMRIESIDATMKKERASLAIINDIDVFSLANKKYVEERNRALESLTKCGELIKQINRDIQNLDGAKSNAKDHKHKLAKISQESRQIKGLVTTVLGAVHSQQYVTDESRNKVVFDGEKKGKDNGYSAFPSFIKVYYDAEEDGEGGFEPLYYDGNLNKKIPLSLTPIIPWNEIGEHDLRGKDGNKIKNAADAFKPGGIMVSDNGKEGGTYVDNPEQAYFLDQIPDGQGGEKNVMFRWALTFQKVSYLPIGKAAYKQAKSTKAVQLVNRKSRNDNALVRSRTFQKSVEMRGIDVDDSKKNILRNEMQKSKFQTIKPIDVTLNDQYRMVEEEVCTPSSWPLFFSPTCEQVEKKITDPGEIYPLNVLYEQSLLTAFTGHSTGTTLGTILENSNIRDKGIDFTESQFNKDMTVHPVNHHFSLGKLLQRSKEEYLPRQIGWNEDNGEFNWDNYLVLQKDIDLARTLNENEEDAREKQTDPILKQTDAYGKRNRFAQRENSEAFENGMDDFMSQFTASRISFAENAKTESRRKKTAREIMMIGDQELANVSQQKIEFAEVVSWLDSNWDPNDPNQSLTIPSDWGENKRKVFNKELENKKNKKQEEKQEEKVEENSWEEIERRYIELKVNMDSFDEEFS